MEGTHCPTLCHIRKTTMVESSGERFPRTIRTGPPAFSFLAGNIEKLKVINDSESLLLHYRSTRLSVEITLTRQVTRDLVPIGLIVNASTDL